MHEKTRFIPVGALEEAFAPDNNSLQSVTDLAGTIRTLYFDNGWTIEHSFTDEKTLVWKTLHGDGTGDYAAERYTAVTPRPGIYFVDFVKNRERATSVSLVLDLERGIFTAVIGQMPTRTDLEVPFVDRIAAGVELTSVRTTILHGAIDAPVTAATPRHEATSDMIGMRIEYTYSPTEQYEHIYLNGDFYAWHCLRGSEKGLCDADRCHYYRLGEQFYLFVWREKIVPTLGIVLVDLERLRTSGKIFGYQGNDFGTLSNFPVGASARVLGVIQRGL